jgi:predicted RNA binding protein YcfA (HicA-like mRNA interferase family)
MYTVCYTFDWKGHGMPSSVKFIKVKKMLKEKGYSLDRINGSHHVFAKPGHDPISIPVHHNEVKYGYVRKIKKLS